MKHILFLFSLLATLQAQGKAFPGAEGFGADATGGRGGRVVHVTSLADDGSAGTLRWACNQQGARTVVFDISGTIFLTNELRIKGDSISILGQTAPGDGICIADYPVTLKASNAVLRYLRFRLGNRHVGEHNGDGFGVSKEHDIIIDHCSVSWSIDECLSVLGCHRTTVQWCIADQSLVNAGHIKGAHGYGGNWGGSGATFHHNLMAHHTSRMPRLGPNQLTQQDERMDMRNNVLYNWSNYGCYGGEGMTVNIVNNYYKPGPGTLLTSAVMQRRIAALNVRTWQYCTGRDGKPNGWRPMLHKWGRLYVAGNVNACHADVTADNYGLGVFNQISPAANDSLYLTAEQQTAVNAAIRMAEPMPCPPVLTQSAAEAYELVLAQAGASLHRDSHDKTIVDDVRHGTATHSGQGFEGQGFINTQDDAGGWPVLRTLPCPTDTDRDGMPDKWERDNGLDPNTPDNNLYTLDPGYTNLEVYCNQLVK